jgi:glycosyltransferase involved in cell wall biosynthesis
VKLVLVGRHDDPQFHQRLQRRTEELGVSEHVWFAGYEPNALPFIANSDVFALASTTDACPMVLVEALASGVPVVSTDCPGGPRFLLDDGRVGHLVPMGDPHAMALAIGEVLTDGGTRERLIARGLERAREFTPGRIAEQYLALAEDCAGRRRAVS